METLPIERYNILKNLISKPKRSEEPVIYLTVYIQKENSLKTVMSMLKQKYETLKLLKDTDVKKLISLELMELVIDDFKKHIQNFNMHNLGFIMLYNSQDSIFNQLILYNPTNEFKILLGDKYFI